MNLKKNSSNSLVIIAIIVAAFFLFGGKTFSNSNYLGGITNVTTQPIGNSTSGTILSLSNIQLYSQSPQLAGLNWLATMVLNNGNQNLFIVSNSSLKSALGNKVGVSKQNTFQFTIVQQKILYPIQSNVGYTLRTYGAAAYPNSFSYKDCNGFSLTVNGSTNMSSTCAFYNNQAYASYYNQCLNQSKKGNTQLGTTIPVQVSGGFWGFGSKYQCWYIYQQVYGTVIELNPSILYQNVSATIDGQTLYVSNYNPISTSSNLQIRLLNPSYTSQQLPGGYQLGTVLFKTSVYGSLEYLENYVPLSSVQQAYNNANYSVTQMYNNATNNNPPQKSAIVGTLGTINQNVYGLWSAANTSISGAAVSYNYSYVIVTDNKATFAHPSLQILANATLMGIYIPVSNFSILNTKGTVVRGGSTNTTYVNVKNTGSVSGSAQVSISCISSPCPFTFVSAQSQGTSQLSPGANQSVGFTIGGTYNNQTAQQATMQFKVCNSVNNCVVANATVTNLPVCTNTQIYNSGTCVNQNKPPTSTTSIPGSNSSTSSTTTTTPGGCPVGQVLNKTINACVFPSGNNGNGGGGGNNGVGAGWYVVVAVIIAAAIIFGLRGNRGGTSRVSSGWVRR